MGAAMVDWGRAPRPSQGRWRVPPASANLAHQAWVLAAILARDPVAIAETLYRHCLNTRDAVVAAVQARFGEHGTADA